MGCPGHKTLPVGTWRSRKHSTGLTSPHGSTNRTDCLLQICVDKKICGVYRRKDRPHCREPVSPLHPGHQPLLRDTRTLPAEPCRPLRLHHFPPQAHPLPLLPPNCQGLKNSDVLNVRHVVWELDLLHHQVHLYLRTQPRLLHLAPHTGLCPSTHRVLPLYLPHPVQTRVGPDKLLAV